MKKPLCELCSTNQATHWETVHGLLKVPGTERYHKSCTQCILGVYKQAPLEGWLMLEPLPDWIYGIEA